MRTAFFVFVVVVSGTLGEIALTHAMKKIGEVHVFTPREIFRMLGRAFRLGWMWAAFGLMALSFFAMLELLSREDVSFVIPATAASYAAGALGAKFLLQEQVCRTRWLGVLLVSFGVALVWMGK
jgi:drug/metabolite transporter (DMT)-like permease